MTKVYIFLTVALIFVLLIFVIVRHDEIAEAWDEYNAPNDIYEDVPRVTGREVFDEWDEALKEMEESSSSEK